VCHIFAFRGTTLDLHQLLALTALPHSLVPLSSLPFPLQDISEDQQLLARLVHNMQAGGGDTDAQHGMVVAAQVRATSGCVLRYRARNSIMPRSSTFCAPQT
jgi:hypothetical protein